MKEFLVSIVIVGILFFVVTLGLRGQSYGQSYVELKQDQDVVQIVFPHAVFGFFCSESMGKVGLTTVYKLPYVYQMYIRPPDTDYCKVLLTVVPKK